jgi:hypothetical protein
LLSVLEKRTVHITVDRPPSGELSLAALTSSYGLCKLSARSLSFNCSAMCAMMTISTLSNST